MPFIMNSDAQLTFFTKVFGSNHDVTAKAKQLIDAGAKFETSLYSLTATFKGKVFQPVNLTVGTTALMKNSADALAAAQNKTIISSWLNDLFNATNLNFPPKPVHKDTMVILKGVDPSANTLLLIKALHDVKPAPTLTITKKLVEDVKAGHELNVGTFISIEAANFAAKKLKAAGGDVVLQTASGAVVTLTTPVAKKPTGQVVNEVIDLRDAQALGQKVHGTSSGSVYHCIAFNNRVKLAARIYKTGSISIRAEWAKGTSPSELNQLKDAGVGIKGDYGSIHFDANDVPLPRVIGAFLLGTGINWDAAVINGADLVIGEHV